MIAGTAKETASLALARMAVGNATPAFRQIRATLLANTADAERALQRAERRELVAAGKLAGSSPYAHAVPLGVELVDQGRVTDADGTTLTIRVALSAPVIDAIRGTVEDRFTGPWFDAEGNAFVSFETVEDATLFRLALDA